MNILIDARCMRINQNGPSSYAKNVLLNLSKLDSRNNYTVLVNKEYSNFISADNFHVITSDIKPYRLREHWAIPHLLKARQFDLFHCMQYVSPLFINCPTVLTIYDIMHMENSFWNDSILHRLMGNYIWLISKVSIKKSVGVVTISHYSATQISKVFGYDIARIYPIHLGTNSLYFNRHRDSDSLYSMKKWGIKNPYLLCIGNMRRHKNIDILINAFSQLVSEGFTDVSLVLGGKAKDEDVLDKQNIVSSLGLGDKVIFIRNMNEEDLAALMGGSSIFIFPSKKEGFGLPLLEAMAAGVPCIASDIEVFREVFGDAPLYFDPNDVTDLKENILKLILSNQLRNELSKKGLQKADEFTWENTAKATINVYERIIEEINRT